MNLTLTDHTTITSMTEPYAVLVADDGSEIVIDSHNSRRQKLPVAITGPLAARLITPNPCPVEISMAAHELSLELDQSVRTAIGPDLLAVLTRWAGDPATISFEFDFQRS